MSSAPLNSQSGNRVSTTFGPSRLVPHFFFFVLPIGTKRAIFNISSACFPLLFSFFFFFSHFYVLLAWSFCCFAIGAKCIIFLFLSGIFSAKCHMYHHGFGSTGFNLGEIGALNLLDGWCLELETPRKLRIPMFTRPCITYKTKPVLLLPHVKM